MGGPLDHGDETMMVGRRFRCYPTAEQQKKLRLWIECQRFIYNAKVAENRYFLAFSRASLSLAGVPVPIDQKTAHFIGEGTEWLRKCPSDVRVFAATNWMGAYRRFQRGLSGRPRAHKGKANGSVWISSRLFRFETRATENRSLPGIWVGRPRNPEHVIGHIPFRAHLEFQNPKSVRIVTVAGKWYLSFAFDDGVQIPDVADTIEWLRGFDEKDLLEKTIGIDRGVATPVVTSDGMFLALPAERKRAAKREEAKMKRWQRKIRRRTRGSANWRKACDQVAKLANHAKNVRKDFAHKASRRIVESRRPLIVFEDLKVPNLVKRPAPAQAANGKWLPNGARQKKGLMRGILDSAWGRIDVYTHYKAAARGMLCVKVPPKYSSQECSECGHVHPDNRTSQDTFRCQACGHEAHADLNAARVLAKRGVEMVACTPQKKRRRCGSCGEKRE